MIRTRIRRVTERVGAIHPVKWPPVQTVSQRVPSSQTPTPTLTRKKHNLAEQVIPHLTTVKRLLPYERECNHVRSLGIW